MQERIRFVLLYFDGIENIHLAKDIGKIPFYLCKNNFDAKLVTFKNSKRTEYTYLDKEVKGLQVEFMNRNFWSVKKIISLKYVILNAKNIDILNLYHSLWFTLLLGLIYKIINKKGILYIKFDYATIHSKNNIFKKVKTYLFNAFFYLFLDVGTIETSASFLSITKKFHSLKDKLYVVPCGVDFHETYKETSHKENIIVTVGRIGNYQKNTDFLLNVINKINFYDWKMFIIGNIEYEYINRINDFFDKNPNLKNKVVFYGEISDRDELFNIYKKSKIFCFTSRWESFGIAAVEAMYYGNYLLTTEIDSSNDLTNFGEYGVIVPQNNYTMYISELQKLISYPSIVESKQKHIQEYVSENFLWSNIIEKLTDILNNKVYAH